MSALFSYAFIFRFLQFLLRFGFVLTFPSVRTITQVGTDFFCFVALPSRRFLAGGFIRAIFISFLFLFLVSETEVGLISVLVERLIEVWAVCPLALTV
jgi:hypothetical protein